VPEAVIVATARSPIGRAFKGSLKDLRPDDLATTIVRAALDKVPALDPHDIDDLMLGCGLPGGEQGMNMGRVVAVNLGYDFLPGTTITRYCSSSLQTTRMALHAIRAGEGHAFISAGVETVSRFVAGNSDMIAGQKLTNPIYDEAQAAHRRDREGGSDTWTDPRERGELPDVYIAMGQTAENLAAIKGVTRQEMDEFAARSQNLAEKAIANGFFEREITPVTTPDGTVVSTGRRPAPGRHGRGHGRASSRSSAPTASSPPATPARSTTARPAVIVMSDTKAAELGITPLAPDRLDRRSPACRRRSWATAPSRRRARRWRWPA
jgi:acetyl-CoA C-acetyltransferase